jgi:hypothetical protein
MPQGPLALDAALVALGKAVPFIGDWTVADGMLPLGATEGPITRAGGWRINGFEATEHTGGLLHKATVTPGAISVSIPVIVGDPDLWAKITPTGSKSGPSDNPIPVQTTGLWLVPLEAFPVSGTPPAYGTIGYNGTVWAPVGVNLTDLFKNAVLFGRGFFTHADVSHPFDNGGKSINVATFTPMYDERLPAGKRGWIIGDPVAEGVTTFRF